MVPIWLSVDLQGAEGTRSPEEIGGSAEMKSDEKVGMLTLRSSAFCFATEAVPGREPRVSPSPIP
jgi:hypothetical protein